MNPKTTANRLAGMMLASAGLFCTLAAQESLALEVVATLLDGQQAKGELLSLGSDSITIQSEGEATNIPTSSVHWLRGANRAESPAVTGASGQIELLSGSVLPSEAILFKDGLFLVELSAPLVSQSSKPLETSRSNVRAYVFRVGSPGQVQQWRRIKQTGSTADLIVVKRKSGETLDYVEGIVTAIDEDKLTVSLDGEAIAVPLAKVYGVVCFHPESDESTTPDLLRVVSPGATLGADQIRLDADGSLIATLPEGFGLKLQLEQVSGIDFSRGGVAALSDLEADSLQWRPLFGPPGEGELALQWGLARRDQSYAGKPLSLRTPGGGLQEYASGLAVRTNGKMTFTTPQKMQRLRATVGVAPDHRCPCQVSLKIVEDGATLFEQTIEKHSSPLEIDVPVTPGGTLNITVERVEGARADAVLHLCQARFTR